MKKTARDRNFGAWPVPFLILAFLGEDLGDAARIDAIVILELARTGAGVRTITEIERRDCADRGVVDLPVGIARSHDPNRLAGAIEVQVIRAVNAQRTRDTSDCRREPQRAGAAELDAAVAQAGGPGIRIGTRKGPFVIADAVMQVDDSDLIALVVVIGGIQENRPAIINRTGKTVEINGLQYMS